MKDKWYADKRDLVKWGSIISIAKSENISKIIQVAFYRKDEKIEINVDDKKIPFPQEVLNHFRKLEDITRLDQTLDITIEVYKEPFQLSAPFKSRKEFRVDFFKKLLDKLSIEKYRIILFLDPDTGISKNDKFEYVTPSEITVSPKSTGQSD